MDADNPPVFRMRIAFYLLLVGITLSACSVSGDPVWLEAPSWGRGLFVADIPESMPYAVVLGEKDETFFAFPVQEGDAYLAHVAGINEDLRIIWEQEFDLELPKPTRLEMLRTDNALDIFWIGGGRLWVFQASITGEVLSAPESLSAPFAIETFDVAVSGDGMQIVFAAGSEDDPGMYALTERGWILLDPLGLAPQLTFDHDGTLHAIWWHDERIEGDNSVYYAAYLDGIVMEALELKITEISLNPADGIEGPVFGIEGETGYVFWTQLFRTGLRAGTIEAHYFSFALADPVGSLFEDVLRVPEGYAYDYAPFTQGEYRAGFRYSWLPGELSGTSKITDISVVDSVDQELAVALRARVSYLRRKEEAQVAVLYLDEGRPTSYQLLSFSMGNSSAPEIRSDELGYLHVAWLEHASSEGAQIYFSSTEPTRQASLTKLTWVDYENALINTLFGMVSGIVLIPFALIWFVLPIIVIFLTSRLRKDSQDIGSAGEIISLLLVMASYWIGRQLILPGMWTYVPFSAWWPMLPEAFEQTLRWVVPFLIALVSLAISWKNTYERGQRSFIYLMLLYMALDAVITMAIYGGIIIDAY
ncbi:MAG: hypothetical protein JXA97_13080 [Anaerolineales bacterium]|nr:hypothetical protein [Anaerolineales bacterium]